MSENVLAFILTLAGLYLLGALTSMIVNEVIRWSEKRRNRKHDDDEVQ